ncbi:hypothetical protein MMC17_006762 [Xylographa soralifera]|nr:hypothetical protein [Xylographa soralifera]
MASSNVLATLRSITSAKEAELVKQRENCRALKESILASLHQEAEQREKVYLLVEQSNAWTQLKEARAIREHQLHSGHRYRGRNGRGRTFGRGGRTSGRGGRTFGRGGFEARADAYSQEAKTTSQYDQLFKLAGINPANLQRYLEQAVNDVSVSSRMMQSWETKLRNALDIQGVRFEYATLFSQLVIERSGETPAPLPLTPDSVQDFELTSVRVAEPAVRPELDTQRKIWEGYVLESREVDISRIRDSLETVFGSDKASKALQALRDSVRIFGLELLKPNQFDKDVVLWVSQGLLRTDLLSDEQNITLKQISENDIYLAEMADVLNMRLASFSNWSWGTDAVPLAMRRQLNGKFRAYMHEEIPQALFLHYIGMKWASFFKGELSDFSAWTKQSFLTKQDRYRRSFFLQETERSGIEPSMARTFQNEYFMSQLPDNERQGTKCYGEDALPVEADQTQSNPLAIKQALLHLLYTDALVADRLSGEVIVLQSDFKWFGPSLSHAAIFTHLEYFGTDQIWIDFFKKFLEAPLRFVDDGPDQIRIRKRGVPMSHALSDMFGEITLFHLDHAIYHATEGVVLYRMHDDILFWSNEKACVRAWTTLKTFAADVGLELNSEKTGASRLSNDKDLANLPLSSILPSKPPKWGFLILDPATGQLMIDQSQVDIHIKEFRRQLEATTSIFAWIQAYNSYVQFIINNLYMPANCFGRNHIDKCLEMLAYVHRELFPGTDGNISEVVKAMLKERFEGSSDIPDGFIYWPMLLGGLEIRNPFVSLQAMRHNTIQDPQRRIDYALSEDEDNYGAALTRFDLQHSRWDGAFGPKPTEFMPWEEFIRFRYECSEPLLHAWEDLRRTAEEEPLQLTGRIEKLLKELPEQGLEGITHDWDKMTPYWQTIVSLHGEEMGEKFGGLEIVEKGLLPMGIVGLWKGEKVRWDA